MGPVEQSNFISRSSARPPPFYSLPPSPAPSPSPFLSPFPSPPAPRLSSTPSLTTPSDHGPTRPCKVPATHAQPAQHHHHSSHPACLASDPNLERRSRAIDSCLLCRWFCLVHTFEDTYCPSSPPSPSLPSLLLALPPLSRARALSLRPSFSASPSKSVHVLSPKS